MHRCSSEPKVAPVSAVNPDYIEHFPTEDDSFSEDDDPVGGFGSEEDDFFDRATLAGKSQGGAENEPDTAVGLAQGRDETVQGLSTLNSIELDPEDIAEFEEEP